MRRVAVVAVVVALINALGNPAGAVVFNSGGTHTIPTDTANIFDTSGLYKGPYVVNAPDLLIGYNKGYRISWDCASGVVAGDIFEDNTKAWSGDHCVDPRQVPGIFFCSHRIDREDPALMDVAPTALKLFGVEPPKHMDGRPLFSGTPQKTERA